jgi:hypothetical protein
MKIAVKPQRRLYGFEEIRAKQNSFLRGTLKQQLRLALKLQSRVLMRLGPCNRRDALHVQDQMSFLGKQFPCGSVQVRFFWTCRSGRGNVNSRILAGVLRQKHRSTA